MTVHFDRFEQAEIDDAIDACLELHTVLQRLRRHKLLAPDEDHRIVDRVLQVCTELGEKIYEVEYPPKDGPGPSGSES